MKEEKGIASSKVQAPDSLGVSREYMGAMRRKSVGWSVGSSIEQQVGSDF